MQTTRNRLVFCHEPIAELKFIDIGKVLADNLMKYNLRSSIVAYTAEDILSETLSSPFDDDIIGPYVGLTNIGILFEPELGFNLRSVLDSASTNKTIVICSDGIINSDQFHFLQIGDNSNINLRGLSYIEI